MTLPSDILVVDDDRYVRDTLAAVLEAEGYGVRCAPNGAQALAMMRDHRPSAMVLDLMMPVMSGWELLELVGTDGDLSQIPVVVLSAVRGPAGVPQLAKPVSLEDLLRALDRVCER